jgi:hypothetical protein
MRSCLMRVGGPNMTHSSTPRQLNRKPHKRHHVQPRGHHEHQRPKCNLIGLHPNENPHPEAGPARMRGRLLAC